MEALLDRVQGGPPVADDLAARFEALGYSSWAYRVVNTAGAPQAALPLGEFIFRMALIVSGGALAAGPCVCYWHVRYVNRENMCSVGFGLPNRRRRVFMLAFLHGDARDVLLSQARP